MSDYPKGTKGICIYCGAHIFTLAADKNCCEQVNASDFNQTQGQAPFRSQQLCACAACGKLFDFATQIRWERPIL